MNAVVNSVIEFNCLPGLAGLPNPCPAAPAIKRVLKPGTDISQRQTGRKIGAFIGNDDLVRDPICDGKETIRCIDRRIQDLRAIEKTRLVGNGFVGMY
ncbi:hypothetical protein [Sagittula sp. S175]|uniref:hypothetical protein n=1 Tax=Sagittula sp. S175 TaxID=3415129 RepID=UPI003C7A99D9